MAKKLTAKQWNARGNVYSDLAEKLADGGQYIQPEENEQGLLLVDGLNAKAQECWQRAYKLGVNIEQAN